MTSEQILAEIREANLSYLMLAQSLIRGDRDQALFRLGVSEETANLIGALTPAQMMKIATGNTLLCRFRMDDDLVWNLLTSHGKGAANDGVARLHASILMAGRHQEAAPRSGLAAASPRRGAASVPKPDPRRLLDTRRQEREPWPATRASSPKRDRSNAR
jgi:flagellar transcriptional activator FlhD